MTEYKKEAPSILAKDIEFYLARISAIIDMEFVCNNDVDGDIPEQLFHLIRMAWDLIPDKESCCHCRCLSEYMRKECCHCGEDYDMDFKKDDSRANDDNFKHSKHNPQ